MVSFRYSWLLFYGATIWDLVHSLQAVMIETQDRSQYYSSAIRPLEHTLCNPQRNKLAISTRSKFHSLIKNSIS